MNVFSCVNGALVLMERSVLWFMSRCCSSRSSATNLMESKATGYTETLSNWKMSTMALPAMKIHLQSTLG